MEHRLFLPKDLSYQDITPYLPTSQELLSNVEGAWQTEEDERIAEQSDNRALSADDILQKGDVVHLKWNAPENLPEGRAYKRFSRKAADVELGAGYFSQEVEDFWCGKPLKTPLTCSFTHKGESIVLTMCATRASRQEELSAEQAFDKALAAAGEDSPYADCDSYDVYKQRRMQELMQAAVIDQFFSTAFRPVVKLVASRSKVEFDPKELEDMLTSFERDAKASLVSKEASQTDAERADALLAYYQDMLGGTWDSLEHAKNAACNQFETIALYNAYARELAKHHGLDLSRTRYEQTIAQLIEEEQCSREKLEEMLTYERFINSESQAFASQELIAAWKNLCEEAGITKLT